MELKKRRSHKRYIASFAIFIILCGCFGAGIILEPGGKIANKDVLGIETGLIENESSKDEEIKITSKFIKNQYLYDDQGNPLAKHVLDVESCFDVDYLYIENGTMLVLHNNEKGIQCKNSNEIKIMIEQKNVVGNTGSVEIGYILDGKPYCIETHCDYEVAITIIGEKGKNYYPYLKNVSSDRVIIKNKYERE